MSKVISPLRDLPVELQQAVFFELHDLLNLRSLALTCRALYLAYINAKVLIENQVLRNEFRLGILPEAFAALQSARLKAHTRPVVKRLVDTHFWIRKAPTQQFASADIAELSRLRRIIHRIAIDFAHDVFAIVPSRIRDDQAPLSDNELARIQRTLYLFEIYHNLFPPAIRPPIDNQGQIDLFFSKLAGWELEQLACMHDYLARTMVPTYNEAISHHELWRGLEVEFHEVSSSGWIQFALSRGLSSFVQIINTTDLDARCSLLLRPGTSYPGHNGHLLIAHLYTSYLPFRAPPPDICPSGEPPRAMHTAFCDDGDDGPVRCWRWAHTGYDWAHYVNCHNQNKLRRLGYVMWDLDRINRWGLLEGEWSRLRPLFRKPVVNAAGRGRGLQEELAQRVRERQGGGGS